MDALEVLFARRSTGRLAEPAPSDEDVTTILRAAAAAPDHDRLRPWRFIVLAGSAKDAFGSVLAGAYQDRCSAADEHVEPAKLEKERTKLGRAPLVIVFACSPTIPSKVPEIEQIVATGAAAQNALLAATALGHGSMWRTGDPGYDPTVKAALGLEEHDTVVGWLYLGSLGDRARPEPNEPSLDGVVVHWSPR